MTFLRKILYITLVIFNCLTLFSQVKEEPKERTIPIEEPVIFKDSLPKISVPDFVITGKEKIEISDRSKIQLDESKIFSLSGKQSPNFETKDVSISESSIPFRKNLSDTYKPDMFSGFVKGEYGNFNSPALSGGAAYGYDIFRASLSGNYISRNENVDNSDFSKGEIHLSLGADLPETQNIFNESLVRLNVSYSQKKYNFYGLQKFITSIYPYESLPFENRLFAIGSSISSHDARFFNYKFDLSFSRFEDSENPELYSYSKNIENIFRAGLSASYDYNGYLFSGGVDFRNSNISNDPQYDKNSALFSMSAGIDKEMLSGLYIHGGLKYYFFNYLFYYYGTGDDRNLFLPKISVRYENLSNLSIEAGYDPDIHIISLSEFYKLNPYILCLQFNHLVDIHNIYLSADYSLKDFIKIKARVGYVEQEYSPYFDPTFSYSKNYSYWSASTFSENAKGMYGKLFIDYQLDPANSFSLRFNYNNKRIENHRILYNPDYSVSLDYFTILSIGLTVNPSINIIGERRIDQFYLFGIEDFRENGLWISDNEEFEKTIFLLNLDAEYPIFNNLIASISLNNIFNTRYSYYSGYEEYPFSIFAGIKFKW